MIAVSLRPAGRRSSTTSTISFASTLYLCPILDLLLSEVPAACREELKLGLQEALVNAAKHGNNLDPSKKVLVEFAVLQNQYWWIISDQGSGFRPPCNYNASNYNGASSTAPHAEYECGRGLYILYQVFDQINWNPQGTELRLCKNLNPRSKLPVRQ